MDTITTINLSRLRNNEHAQFNTSVITEIEAIGAEILGISKLMSPYKIALKNEQIAIDVEEGSRHTLTIEQTDAWRDEIYRSFGLYIKSKKLSYIPEERQAATTVYRIIKQAGNLRAKDYNEESDGLRSIVSQLKTGYAPELQILKAAEIVDELEKANNQFIQNFDVRANEVAARPEGNARVTRVETDNCYRAVTLALQGLALVNDAPAYATVIDKINYLVDYYKNALAFRQATAKENNKEPESPEINKPN